jgi:hypothetical protein
MVRTKDSVNVSPLMVVGRHARKLKNASRNKNAMQKWYA